MIGEVPPTYRNHRPLTTATTHHRNVGPTTQPPCLQDLKPRTYRETGKQVLEKSQVKDPE